jgi:hypothetical protein
MAKSIDLVSPEAIPANDQQEALLSWAATRIDQIRQESDFKEHLAGLLDWIAHFTRERFGFQQRLLTECSQHREYFLRRMAVHCEFRRRLYGLYIDSLYQDPTVTERLRALCRDLLQDAQAHEKAILEMLRKDGAGPRLRTKPRRGQVAADN